MPARAAAERWPGLSFGPDPVMFHPDGGVIDPERAMAAMRRIAAARGAQVSFGTRVLRVEAGRRRDRAHGGPVVARPGRDGRGRRLAGAAARRAGAAAAAGRDPDAGVPLRAAGAAGRGRCSSVTTRMLTCTACWAGGTAEVPGAVKIGAHSGPVTTGDGRDGIVRQVARDRASDFVRQHLPGLDPDAGQRGDLPVHLDREQDFILDRYGPFVVCSPCSGHGAKFAPLIGEIAADLACGGPPPDAVHPRRPSRLGARTNHLYHRAPNTLSLHTRTPFAPGAADAWDPRREPKWLPIR